MHRFDTEIEITSAVPQKGFTYFHDEKEKKKYFKDLFKKSFKQFFFIDTHLKRVKKLIEELGYLC